MASWSKSTQPAHGYRRASQVLASVGGVLVLALGGMPLPANAAPPAHTFFATPPAPAAPVALFTENFENGFTTSTTPPVLLTSYVGAPPTSQTYTADAVWVNAATCNGIVLSQAGPDFSGCGSNASLKQLAQLLGSFPGGPSSVNENHAVSAFTSNGSIPPGANSIQFQTVTPIPLTVTGRFITFSVDAAAISCFSNHPLLKFYLLDGSTELAAFNTPIDPCGTSTTTGSGTFTGNSAQLFTGSALGIRLRNGQASAFGNDNAFDNIRVLDATPQLSKEFASGALADQPNALTFTVTNTSELAAKAGWSFTDALPTGMTVATPSGAATTCTNGVVTAVGGTGSISVAGDLTAGQTSCTITVNVVAGAGTYTNSATNITTSTGILPPDPATVTFIGPPTAANDTASTPPGTPVTIDPLDNDTLPPGETFLPGSVVLIGPGGTPVTTLTTPDGTYTVNATTGHVTFTPVDGFTGTTTPVTYRVTAASGLVVTATITVNVSAPGPITSPPLTEQPRIVPDSLPLTGVISEVLTPLASLLIFFGFALVVLSRSQHRVQTARHCRPSRWG